MGAIRIRVQTADKKTSQVIQTISSPSNNIKNLHVCMKKFIKICVYFKPRLPAKIQVIDL